MSGASSYRLDVSTASNFATFVTGYQDLTVTGTSQAVTGLSGGTTYYYRIRAVNSGGTTNNSNTITVLTVPAAPAVQAATSVGSASFTANWSASTGAASYRLDVSAASDFSTFVTGYQDLTVSGTSQSVTGLVANTQYYYRVRAVNASGTSANSGTQSVTTLSAPANTAVPTISGTSRVGETLTASAGTWTGNPTPTLTYQWQKCDAAGANCLNITGATNGTYLLVSGDQGSTIRVVETGTNSQGTASATSTQTAAVAAALAAPVNTAVPVITGTLNVGQQLSSSTGTWTGNPTPTLSYQWQRCNAEGAACAPIDGATTNAYTLVSADVGSTIRVAVTGTNSSGAATATSTQTTVVTSGTAAPGALTGLNATAGDRQVALNWTAPASNGGASITDYVIQVSSDSGPTWSTFNDGISTATSTTVTGLTNNRRYVFRVAAVNSVGTGAFSAPSASVFLSAPVAVVPTELAMKALPDSIFNDVTLTPAVQVQAVDSSGKVDASFNGEVRMELIGAPDSVVLSGTLVVRAVAGIATFSDLRISHPGSGFVLKATDPSGKLAVAPSAPFVVHATPTDLEISITASNLNPVEGDTLSYTVTVSNKSPAGALGVVVAAPVPPRMRFVRYETAVGRYDSATGAWQLGTLAGNAKATLVITVAVRPQID